MFMTPNKPRAKDESSKGGGIKGGRKREGKRKRGRGKKENVEGGGWEGNIKGRRQQESRGTRRNA